MATDTSFLLSRMLGRIASLQRAWLRLSLKEHLDIEPEWYFFLYSIDSRQSTRKTDIISYNLLFEPTTGIDILNRMIRAGLLTEKVDPMDKRARLLSTTKKGKTTLRKAQHLAQQVADTFFGSMPASLKEEFLAHLDAIEDSLGHPIAPA
ncbi:MAG: MarR family transcriptional regulator [Bacteroidetes bacterium]|nr:MarR family transcriptional regulator [Bacteroidota bacterium]